MHTSQVSAAIAAFLIHCTEALVPRASLPPKFTVEDIGQQTSNFLNVYRDGGSGGTVNGLNLITFSDTTTTSGGTTGTMKGFSDNTIAYMGQNGAAINSLTDFGTNNIPRMPIPFQKNESDYTNQHFSAAGDGRRCVLWPQGSIATLADGKTGIAVYPVSIYGTGGGDLYNTLVTITADSTNGPAVERTVPQLFYAGEPLYGKFGTIRSHDTNDLYLFASEFDTTTFAGGMRVAKVDISKYKDRGAYLYWTGSQWSSDIKAGSAASGLLFNSNLSTGDVFWNEFYKTYMVIYFNGFASSTFYMRYSLDGTITGKWSDEFTLKQTVGDTTNTAAPYNYAGHAYPTLDTTGQTVTLSYTKSGGAFTEMLKVTFS